MNSAKAQPVKLFYEDWVRSAYEKQSCRQSLLIGRLYMQVTANVYRKLHIYIHVVPDV